MKPSALLEELVRRYTPQGGIVLDCCMGRGVCGVAALAAGRRFLGVEMQQDRFDYAVCWLASAAADDTSLS